VRQPAISGALFLRHPAVPPRWSSVELPETNLAPATECGARRGETAARPRRRRKRPPPGYITVTELAERSESAASTAYHWVATGKLPASQWRGITVIAEHDAEAFVAIRPLRHPAADPTATASSTG